MKRAGMATALLCLGLQAALAQGPSGKPGGGKVSDRDIDRLNAKVASQAQELAEQKEDKSRRLQAAFAEQRQMLEQVLHPGAGDGNGKVALAKAAAVTAPKASTEAAVAAQQATPQPAALQSEQKALDNEEEVSSDQVGRDQEVAEEKPVQPALQLGPAKLRFIGYVALTGLYRSNNSGGNVGTSFGGIPFDNTVAGHQTEFRLSPQSTRFAIRADANLGSSKLAGYFETDFAGTVPGNVAVTSSSYGFRMRHAWADFEHGKFELTAGQMFSLMTPNRRDILPWPSDEATLQEVDTNYTAGLVWGRFPSIRFAYHFTPWASLGFSLENPEQQTGRDVVFPSKLSASLMNQYNTGANELRVANRAPDLVAKLSLDGTPGGHFAHLDIGLLGRAFRSYDPSLAIHNHTANGGGVEIDTSLEVVKNVRVLLNGFASDGGGRYIGGLLPDVVIRADGRISPVKAYSYVTGVEYAPNKLSGYFAYFSGLYGQANSALDTNGSYLGWGYPGASTAADRSIQEFSVGYARTLWKGEGLGSIQLNSQYSYLWLRPWAPMAGQTQANAHMVFSQIRYNLP